MEGSGQYIRYLTNVRVIGRLLTFAKRWDRFFDKVWMGLCRVVFRARRYSATPLGMRVNGFLARSPPHPPLSVYRGTSVGTMPILHFALCNRSGRVGTGGGGSRAAYNISSWPVEWARVEKKRKMLL